MYIPQKNTLRQILIHPEEFGHNLNVFTFLETVLTPHIFGHLANS